MELDATHKALFREIDNIEDENAYRLEMLKKSEQNLCYTKKCWLWRLFVSFDFLKHFSRE